MRIPKKLNLSAYFRATSNAELPRDGNRCVLLVLSSKRNLTLIMSNMRAKYAKSTSMGSLCTQIVQRGALKSSFIVTVDGSPMKFCLKTSCRMMSFHYKVVIRRVNCSNVFRLLAFIEDRINALFDSPLLYYLMRMMGNICITRLFYK
uniref:Chromo domain-containing protein n=1 Tax=Parascaris univalens TaxID=6257 RepID=A0A915BEX2_PARUN